MSFLSSGLINFNWDNISNYTDEEISYFLYLEGKKVDVISKIRNEENATIQKHIINCKIKYRYIAKSKSPEELFKTISKAVKVERINVISNLSVSIKEELIKYIRNKYVDFNAKEKESAIWILGELKDKNSLDILIKGSVNKFTGIRRMAISAMGKIGDISAENALIRALDDDNSQVVQYAVKALIRVDSIKCYEKLKSLYHTTDKEYLKKNIQEYLDKYNKLKSESELKNLHEL